MKKTYLILVALSMLECAGKPAILVTHTGNSATLQAAKENLSINTSRALAEYPKVLVPNYQITLQTDYFAMNKGNVIARFAKTTGTMQMKVAVDAESLSGVIKEATEISRDRFKKKLTAFGFEVLDEQNLKNTNEDVKKWYTKNAEPSPKKIDLGNDSGLLYGSDGAMSGTFFGGCNFTRDIKAGCQLPQFVVALGGFVDADGPGVIKASHENVELFFKPELRLSNGTIFNGEYRSGGVGSKKPLVYGVDGTGASKTSDNSAAASANAQANLDWARSIGATNRIFAFSHGNKQFELKPDPTKFRAALLAALEEAENQMLELYAAELK